MAQVEVTWEANDGDEMAGKNALRGHFSIRLSIYVWYIFLFLHANVTIRKMRVKG